MGQARHHFLRSDTCLHNRQFGVKGSAAVFAIIVVYFLYFCCGDFQLMLTMLIMLMMMKMMMTTMLLMMMLLMMMMLMMLIMLMLLLMMMMPMMLLMLMLLMMTVMVIVCDCDGDHNDLISFTMALNWLMQHIVETTKWFQGTIFALCLISYFVLFLLCVVPSLLQLGPKKLVG